MPRGLRRRLRIRRDDRIELEKKRMEHIMYANFSRPSSLALRAVLGVLVAFAVLVPLATGSLQAQQPPAVAPDQADVFFQSGVANLAQKKYQQAEEAFRKAYEMDRSNVGPLMGLVEVYAAQKKMDEALKLLHAEVEKNPARLDIRLALGNIYVRNNQYDLALAEFQKVLDGTAKNSREAGDLYMRIGETYRRKGDLNSSIAALRQAKELLPGNLMVMGTLALVLDNSGQKKAAELVYRAVIEADRNNGVALNNLSFLLGETGGDLDAALEYAQRARRLLPNLAEVADTVGWIYLKKNMTGDAIAIFRDLVQKQPSNSSYHYHLAVALEQDGDHSAAREELNAALKSNPSQADEQKIKELLQKIGG
jgi:tetratricopeptide (TPR) repeat protein